MRRSKVMGLFSKSTNDVPNGTVLPPVLSNVKLSPITGKPVRKYSKTGKHSNKNVIKQKMGRWTPEDATTVVADYQGFLDGKFSNKTLENKYRRSIKQIAHKANYDSNGGIVEGTFASGKKMTVDQVISLLKEAKLGRGWRSKVKNVLTNPTHNVQWDKQTENRLLEVLASEDIAILHRLKSGKVRVFTERGWKGWKNGATKGLQSIHGRKFN